MARCRGRSLGCSCGRSNTYTYKYTSSHVIGLDRDDVMWAASLHVSRRLLKMTLILLALGSMTHATCFSVM